MQGMLEFLSDLVGQVENLDPVSRVDFFLKIFIYPLTLINTYLLIKEKSKKPRLILDIEYSAFLRRGKFIDFKIDLVATANNEDIYIREVFLFNQASLKLISKARVLWVDSLSYYSYDGPVCNGKSWNISFCPPIKKIFVEKGITNGALRFSEDISDKNIENFVNFKEEQWFTLGTEDWEQGIVGLKIAKNSVLSLSLVGELRISEYNSEESYLKSHRRVPKSGWYICCNYGVNKVVKKLSLKTRNLWTQSYVAFISTKQPY